MIEQDLLGVLEGGDPGYSICWEDACGLRVLHDEVWVWHCCLWCRFVAW